MRVPFLPDSFSTRTRLFCLVMGLLVFGSAMGQNSETEFFRSELTGGLSPIVDLRGRWLDVDDETITVPFLDRESDRRDMGRLFDIPDFASRPDTMYLYFEGLAWTAEVRLNGAFLALTENPFAEHIFPVRKDWLRPSNNRLEIVLRREGPSQVLFPERFLGIYRQVFLLGPDSLYRFAPLPRKVSATKRVVVIAPWSEESGIIHDTVAVGRALQGLFSYPYPDPVYFPFRPSARSLALATRLGVTLLDDLSGADSLCFYNYYPISREAGAFTGRFWRDEKYNPTQAYGRFLGRESLQQHELRSADKPSLLILLLAPVLFMLLLKLIAPRIYAGLPEYLTKTKIYLELIAGSKYLKDEQRWVMNLMRMTFTAIFVSLYIYYVSLSGDWRRLNILSSGSLLFHYFDGTTPSLYLIFLKTLAAVTGLNLLKYIMLNLVGSIFRVFGFSTTLQSLDVFASFPLNLLPIAPAAIIFFLEAEAGGILLYVWHALILIYFLRRIILVFSGLTKLFQFSTGIKILYICSLELAPWIFLI